LKSKQGGIEMFDELPNLGRIFFIMLAAVASLITQPGSNLFAEETYHAEILIEAPWGTGEGEVSLFKGPHENYGPPSFYVYEDNIYILDRAKRVLQYDSEGRYIKSFPVNYGGAGDILVNNDFIYIINFHRGMFSIYDKKGVLLKEGRYLEDSRGCISGLSTGVNGEILLKVGCLDNKGLTEDRYVYYTLSESREGIDFGSKLRTGRGFRDKGRYQYYLKKADHPKASIGTTMGNNKSKDKTIVGTDGNGNNYIYSSEFTERGLEIVIKKYSSQGDLMAQIDLTEPLITGNRIPPPYAGGIAHGYLRITASGDLYYRYDFKDKFIIIKYSR
jgi:hypothetical protein